MAARLVEVPGVLAVLLGGSRARGERRADSDWDLGVYYREPLELAALRPLAAATAGEPVAVAGPGGWGPWVNGGAWLTVGEAHVDWILRDLDRVRQVWAECREGRYEVGVQANHPLGFWSPCYPGEVALGRVLADPVGELTAVQGETAEYPEPLRRALIDASWESEFILGNAAKPAGRGDVLLVSLALSRALGVLVQGLFAAERRWCLNEKGALDRTPAWFADRARPLLAAPGHDPRQLTATVTAARALTADTRAALGATR
jgi:hypothetical protein